MTRSQGKSQSSKPSAAGGKKKPDFTFTLHEEPNGAWVPVMHAPAAMDMEFLAPNASWHARSIKVFQVYSEDTKDLPEPGFGPDVTNAGMVKTLIMTLFQLTGAVPNAYGEWNKDCKRYCGKNHKPVFDIDTSTAGRLLVRNHHNRGKVKNKSPVYDFIMHWQHNTNPDPGGDPVWEDVLVDPGVRNEH